MGVHALGADAAVEGLSEGIVGWLARPREVEDNAALVGLQVEIAGDELGPLVDTDGRRVADRRTDPVERLNHILAPVAEPRIKHRREPRERVDDYQHAQLRPVASWLASDPFKHFDDVGRRGS